MVQKTQFKWDARPNALETVYEFMQPSVRFTLDDCVELPEEVFITQAPELSKQQEKAYKAMWDELQADIDGVTATAVNEAAKMNKLLQISCGAVYTDSEDDSGARDYADLTPKPRLDAMCEVINESEGKVLVFVPFANAIEIVKKKLTSEGIGFRIITGASGKTARDSAFNDFRNDPSVRVLVAQPATMSHGLTLTEATTILWYGLVVNNETFEQANARVRRPGQTRKTAVVAFATTAVEKRLLRRLRDKQSAQGLLLEMIRNGIDPKATTEEDDGR